jgi:hypothetical protein
MTDLLKPGELKKISDEIDMENAKKAFERMKAVEKERDSLRDAFMHRDLHPDVKNRVNASVRRAAEQGHNQLQVLTFPAAFCNDRGRRINNMEPDWPDSLEGFAKKAYEFFVAELKPLGYRVSAQVLDYPEGMPGNIGLFLNWER